MNFQSRIVALLYSGITRIAPIFLNFSAFFNPKIKKLVEGQREISLKQQQLTDFKSIEPELPFIWFHCASLGEFEMGRPLIEAYKNRFPSHKIVITFFSSSGYEIRKNYQFADYVMYLPLDNLNAARKFVKIINPKLCVFVKYEFWPYIIQAIHENRSALIGISVLARQNQLYFKTYGQFFKQTLQRFDALFVQNEDSYETLKNNGFSNVILSGDTRFDRVYENAQNVKRMESVEAFIQQHKTMVVGSTWQADMDVLIPFINQNPDLKFIIAPHEIKASEILKWQQEIKLPSVNYSAINAASNTAQVLFIDSIGLLSSLYQYADYAYIGGGFGKGLHNILEAVVFEIPIFFGNSSYHKFPESIELIKRNVAFTVANASELENSFSQLDEATLKIIAHSAKQFISLNRGATALIMNKIETIIEG